MGEEKKAIVKYKNDEVTVLWEPGKCIHAGNCARGLPKVFRPTEKPWVDINGASSNEIRNQVSQCPSGALSIEN